MCRMNPLSGEYLVVAPKEFPDESKHCLSQSDREQWYTVPTAGAKLPLLESSVSSGARGTWASSLLQTGAATISVPGEGDIDVSTAHIPNGSKYGWKKIDSNHVLSAGRRGASDSPRILTDDLSEP